MLTDSLEVPFFLSFHSAGNLPLHKHSEAFIQPKMLPAAVGYQVTCPTVGNLMSYNLLGVNVKSEEDTIKVPVRSIHNLIPQNFFKHHVENLTPEDGSYLESFMCEVSCARAV